MPANSRRWSRSISRCRCVTTWGSEFGGGAGVPMESLHALALFDCFTAILQRPQQQPSCCINEPAHVATFSGLQVKAEALTLQVLHVFASPVLKAEHRPTNTSSVRTPGHCLCHTFGESEPLNRSEKSQPQKLLKAPQRPNLAAVALGSPPLGPCELQWSNESLNSGPFQDKACLLGNQSKGVAHLLLLKATPSCLRI